jgi:hypothetical protein
MPNMIASIAIIVTESGRCLNDSLSVLNQVICIGSIYIEINYSLLFKIFLYFYVEDLSYLITTISCATCSQSSLSIRL